MLQTTAARPLGSPLLARQHATAMETKAAAMIRAKTTDCGEDRPSPSNSATNQEGAMRSAIPVPASTSVIAISRYLDMTTTTKGIDTTMQKRAAHVGHPV